MPGHSTDRTHSHGARCAAVLLFAASALTCATSLANTDTASQASRLASTTLIVTPPDSHADRLRRTKQVDPAQLRFTLHVAGPGTGYRLERSDTGSATL